MYICIYIFTLLQLCAHTESENLIIFITNIKKVLIRKSQERKKLRTLQNTPNFAKLIETVFKARQQQQSLTHFHKSFLVPIVHFHSD